ncbi:hypothetical protein GCM10010236_75280 [Streptomyces eurythermus]|nr:hypothetical protein GCM10010236_75280 [Streptomyces eurythermus]
MTQPDGQPQAQGPGPRPSAFGEAQYCRRNAVERCVSKWKQYWAVARRYDRRDYVFNGTLAVTAIIIWLRDTVQEPSEAPWCQPALRSG